MFDFLISDLINLDSYFSINQKDNFRFVDV
jgi:hypothetical protein